MPKFAFYSHVLPPSATGQAVAIYRLLSGVDRDRYYLISRELEVSQGQNKPDRFRLDADRYTLPLGPMPKKAERIWIYRLLDIFHFLRHLCIQTSAIYRLLRKVPTSMLIACTGDRIDIPAGFLASRLARIPFYAYIFDDFAYQWTGISRLFAGLTSPIIFRHSTGLIGPNEFLCDEYRRRYGVTPSLIHNPCDGEELGQEPLTQWPEKKTKINIVYTGAIYHTNYDCFRNLIQAMDILISFPLELHIYTAQSPEQLAEQGINHKKIQIHSHIPYREIVDHQRKADILFLPLAFSSTISEVIRTSAPGKMGEYLASGRPILMHAPADSYVTWYFRTHECGAVADENDPHSLADVMRQIITNRKYRKLITGNALVRARIDFDPAAAQSRFLQLLGISSPKNIP